MATSAPCWSSNRVPLSSNSMTSPASRMILNSSRADFRRGCGATSASPSLTSVMMRRRSARVLRAESPIAVTARTATAGSSSAAYLAPSVWLMMTETEWTTTSCSSRTMRSRAVCSSSESRRSRCSRSASCRSPRSMWRPRAAINHSTRNTSARTRRPADVASNSRTGSIVTKKGLPLGQKAPEGDYRG